MATYASRPAWDVKVRAATSAQAATPAALALIVLVSLLLWIRVFGTSEIAVRSLSLVCAALAVIAAWWAGRVLFGARAGWMAAALAATTPYLTTYAQEARMYALVALLGILACACLGRVLAVGATAAERRPWALGAAATLAAMLYT